jgi:hypothetical protein
MLTDLTLTVALRGADPVALTAEHALTHRLGYGGVLAELARRDLWRLRLDASGVAEALALAGSWVTRSNVFVNPNKHVYELASSSTGDKPARAGGRTAWVVAWSEPDLEGEAAVRLIQARFGGRELAHVRKALVWMLRFSAGVGADEVKRRAEEIAVARSRLSGLLTNPHFQSVAVVRAADPRAAVAAAFGAPAA